MQNINSASLKEGWNKKSNKYLIWVTEVGEERKNYFKK